jgi:hypothetical protein
LIAGRQKDPAMMPHRRVLHALVAMMLASCNSIPSAFAPDETTTTGVTTQTNETPPERSAEDRNSISGGAY